MTYPKELELGDKHKYAQQKEIAYKRSIPLENIEGAIYVRYKKGGLLEIFNEFIPLSEFASFNIYSYKTQRADVFKNFIKD